MGKLRLTEVKEETPDAKSFIFEKPAGFSFVAGQFVHWSIPHDNPDSRGPSRPISISASPTEDFLMFTTKFAPAGGSTLKNKLQTVEAGFETDIDDPMGRFVLPEDTETPIVFLGGGVGITPFRSMIKFSTDTSSPRKLTLLYANKTPADIIFRKEFDEWSGINPNFEVFYTVDTPDGGWVGDTGHLTPEMIKKYVPDLASPLFYICGPAGMIEAYRGVLTELDLGPEKIVTENFTGYQ